MFGLHQSLRLELAQAFPTSLHMIQVPDGNLEEMLEELLADVKLHKAKNGAGNGGNLFDTASFFSSINALRKYPTSGASNPISTRNRLAAS